MILYNWKPNYITKLCNTIQVFNQSMHVWPVKSLPLNDMINAQSTKHMPFKCPKIFFCFCSYIFENNRTRNVRGLLMHRTTSIIFRIWYVSIDRLICNVCKIMILITRNFLFFKSSLVYMLFLFFYKNEVWPNTRQLF